MKFAPLSQPIRSETKTNCDLLAFSHASCKPANKLASRRQPGKSRRTARGACSQATLRAGCYKYFLRVLIYLLDCFPSFVNGQSDYFMFGFTKLNQLKTAPIQNQSFRHSSEYWLFNFYIFNTCTCSFKIIFPIMQCLQILDRDKSKDLPNRRKNVQNSYKREAG